MSKARQVFSQSLCCLTFTSELIAAELSRLQTCSVIVTIFPLPSNVTDKRQIITLHVGGLISD